MGVANDHSIAWGIAKALAAEGAKLAFTSGRGPRKTGRAARKEPGSELILPVTSRTSNSVEAVFSAISAAWGKLDFLVHCIGFSDKNELKGRYADASRENFIRTMVVSAFSFTEIAKRAAALMPLGGAMLASRSVARRVSRRTTMSWASPKPRSRPACVTSLRIRPGQYGVNAISAGPVRTLAGAGVADARFMFNFQRDHSPLKRSVTIENVGGSALYLLSNLSEGVTGKFISSIAAITSSRCRGRTTSSPEPRESGFPWRKIIFRWL